MKIHSNIWSDYTNGAQRKEIMSGFAELTTVLKGEYLTLVDGAVHRIKIMCQDGPEEDLLW